MPKPPPKKTPDAARKRTGYVLIGVSLAGIAAIVIAGATRGTQDPREMAAAGSTGGLPRIEAGVPGDAGLPQLPVEKVQGDEHIAQSAGKPVDHPPEPDDPVRCGVDPARFRPAGGEKSFAKFHTKVAKRIRITVTTQQGGNLIRILHDGIATDLEVPWDGRDSAGTIVPEGAYYMGFETDGRKEQWGVFVGY